MFEAKYKYNPKTLTYEKVAITLRKRLLKIGFFILTGLVFAVLIVISSYSFIDSPREKRLQRENQQLSLQYEIMNSRLSQMEGVLEDIQKRDDYIYREIFEAEPIPNNIRKAGFGGVNRYKQLYGYDNSELTIETSKRLDKLSKQLYIQSKSFDEVYEMAKQKEKMLASIPAIQPISNKDLTRVASGFGMRIHPIYKTRRRHDGMDFTAKIGTDIYATGNGKVVEVVRSRRGYGNHVVIDHGYGYRTLYAHMNKFKVRKGQKVKRGEIIGYVGNTGTSAGPHLHYEVVKNERKINPVNFYFNDLSPEEYEQMIEISSASNQSFD
ncbi:MAG: peptidase M23 [Flavobacteriales bacterium]|nr:MAG: peptidase M23 [Flavobacteriales bacterium]